MKKFLLALLYSLLSLNFGEVTAQSTSQPRWNVASWEPGLGMVFRHEEGFSAARICLGTRNLLIKNRVGFYYVLEYRGGIKFIEDGTNFYFRDLLGLNFSINKNFSVHGGMGVFRKGILLDGELRGGGYYWSNLQHGRLRKEIGITYRIPEYPISVDISYSFWVGPTATFGYIIPMKQKRIGNAPLKSIPVYDVPVVVEIKPEKIATPPVIDTVVTAHIVLETIPEKAEQPTVVDTVAKTPIVVETKPEKVEQPVVIDTVVEQVAKTAAETTPEVDLTTLAKQSTTYYPFNQAELSASNKQKLEALVSYMKSNTKCRATLFGNADVLGSESYNLTLSLTRAQNVKKYLISQGVEARRIKVVAYGEMKAKGETEEERALNRCVEFLIQTK